MPVERHWQDREKDREQDVIRYLRARLDECEAYRAGMAAAVERERGADRAEIRMLRARIADTGRLLAAQQEAAAQIRAEAWRAGFAAGHAAGLADEAPPGRREGRWLRAVQAMAVPVVLAMFRAGGRSRVLVVACHALARHKMLLAVPVGMLAAGAMSAPAFSWAVPAPSAAAPPASVVSHAAGP